MAVQLTHASPGPRPAAQAVPSPLSRLSALEAEVRQRLGSLVAGAVPLLDEVRSLVAALHPEADSADDPPPPAEAAKMRARLAGALDELEDLLEALLMARDAGAARRGG